MSAQVASVLRSRLIDTVLGPVRFDAKIKRRESWLFRLRLALRSC